MKLKLIDDTQIVVDKFEYAKLVRLENILQGTDKEILLGVNPKFYSAIDLDTTNVYVVMNIDGFRTRIKCFNSDDLEYNLVCANELVELLNKEQ